MKRIVTLTVNPAVDVNVRSNQVIADKKLRCSNPRYELGGGGINVSRALRRLGGFSTALYTTGGRNGELLQELLTKEGINHKPIPIKNETGENFSATERKSGHQYRFTVPGPDIEKEEWQSLFRDLFATRPIPEFIVASGSYSNNVPDDFYACIAKKNTQFRY